MDCPHYVRRKPRAGEPVIELFRAAMEISPQAGRLVNCEKYWQSFRVCNAAGESWQRDRNKPLCCKAVERFEYGRMIYVGGEEDVNGFTCNYWEVRINTLGEWPLNRA